MTKPFLLAALLAACGYDAVPADDAGDGPGDPAPPPPSSDAVALARTPIGGSVHLVLVASDDGSSIAGADLGELAGPILDHVGVRGIDGLLADAATAPTVQASYEDLLPPVDFAGGVAVVDNFPGQGTPYLYPSVAEPDGPVGPIDAVALLDYQVQLCAVLGEEVATVEAFATARVGFVLCHQAIDREIQIREGDLEHPERAAGLPAAGNRRGYYRVGPYLYYPRDRAGYLATAAIQLAVDGEVRQSARVDLTADLADLAAETLVLGNAKRWQLDDEDLALVPGSTLPAGLVFLTGTPGGFAYKPPTEDFLDDAERQYFRDGGFLTGQTLDDYVADKIIDAQRANPRYLAAGDDLEITGTNVGTIRLAIL